MHTLELEPIIAAAAMVGLRVSGILVFAPFFGSNSIPPRIKAALALALTLLLYPVCGTRFDFKGPLNLIPLIAGELVVGLLIGLSVNIVFEAAQMAGQILGIQMGYSLVNVIDPQTQVETPVLGVFHQTITMLIFLRLDVHHWILRAVARSYQYLPAGFAWPSAKASGALLVAAGSIWITGLQIAAPALAATVMADFALAFLGKASPQLPILVMGLSLKSVLGMVTIIACLAYWPRVFETHFTRSIEFCERLLRLAH